MAGFSTYMEGLIAGWLNGTDMPVAPVALYVALFDGDPTDAGSGGTEITTTVRTAGRVTGTFSKTAGVLTSTSLIDFGESEATVSISHIAIYDAVSAGNMLGSVLADVTPLTVGAGTSVKWPIGNLVIGVQ